MKIVVLDADTVSNNDIDFSMLKSVGDVTFFGNTKAQDVASRIGDAQAVLCNKSPITRDVITQCQNLQYIGLFSTGFNNVDLDAADERNIVVSNVPQYSTDAVAQHVFAFILKHFSRVDEYDTTVKNGDWVRSELFSYFTIPMTEIKGLTLGIIGFGNIGQKVSQIALAFGLSVIVYTKTIPEGFDNIRFVSLKELFCEADIVSLHCPLNEQTKGIINSQTLSLMKRDAILINTARGPLVNEDELADALNKNIISHAYLDVVCIEPMLENNPLRNAERCTMTPHVAWSPLKTRERLVDIAVQNIIDFIDKRPHNVVNKGSVV